jgi:hypothetical protein
MTNLSTLPLPLWRADGGDWNTAHDAVVRGNGVEWASLCGEPLGQRNVLVSVRIAGTAGGAGISFGAFKDFIAPVDAATGERLLQFDVDGKGWMFRVDGVRVERVWWDGAVRTVDDLFDGPLSLKARNAEEVTFRDFRITPYEANPLVTVIMTCYRFAQRLRVALTSWCRQEVPSGTLEVIVLNPESPDGTHELIASMAAAYPEVRLCEVRIDAAFARNKGWMLNRGVEVSRGDWIWLTDADCVFPSDAVAKLLASNADTNALTFGERRHLTKASTDLLLAGRIGPEEVSNLDASFVEAYPWGYTQIFHRSQFARIRYREDLDHFAGSDESFLDTWRNAGLLEQRLEGLACLHLQHPFAWYGTTAFL